MTNIATLVRSLFLSTALATLPSVYSCGGEEDSKACVSDTECKGEDRVCADGQCVYRDGKGDGGNTGELSNAYVDEDGNYTCESGVRMTKDLCLDYLPDEPNRDDLRKNLLNGKLFTNCERKTDEGNPLQELFECNYAVCSNPEKAERVYERLEGCDVAYWSKDMEYNCEDACKKLVYECECTDPLQRNFDECVNIDCKGGNEPNQPWSQEKINYVATLDCVEDDPC